MATPDGFSMRFDGLDRVRATIKGLGKDLPPQAFVRIGFESDKRYDAENGGQLVAYIASIQEFGAPKRRIPPRPFFRNMINKHAGEWPDQVARALVFNKLDGLLTLKQMGLLIEGELRQSIIDLVDPPLSPRTIAGRLKGKKKGPGFSASGAAKPLVATGTMLDSITSKVVTGEPEA